jgi:hypothetical protein
MSVIDSKAVSRNGNEVTIYFAEFKTEDGVTKYKVSEFEGQPRMLTESAGSNPAGDRAGETVLTLTESRDEAEQYFKDLD